MDIASYTYSFFFIKIACLQHSKIKKVDFNPNSIQFFFEVICWRKKNHPSRYIIIMIVRIGSFWFDGKHFTKWKYVHEKRKNLWWKSLQLFKIFFFNSPKFLFKKLPAHNVTFFLPLYNEKILLTSHMYSFIHNIEKRDTLRTNECTYNCIRVAMMVKGFYID